MPANPAADYCARRPELAREGRAQGVRNIEVASRRFIVKEIKVLGSGCANCATTYELIRTVADEKGVDVRIEKVEDIGSIMSYGVMSTPGVVIDGTVVHAGGLPDRKSVEQWLS